MCLSRLSQLQIERVEPVWVKGIEYTVNVSRDYTQYSILQWKFYDNKMASSEWVNEYNSVPSLLRDAMWYIHTCECITL